MIFWLLTMYMGQPAFADEGMWLPEQMPSMAENLVEMGLVLPPEDLDDPLAYPLNAVVSLGGCSAAFLSNDGLIGTNHHCVSGYLGYNSTSETPYGADGYAATGQADEMSAGPSARLYVVTEIEDVTRTMMHRVGRLRGERRLKQVARNRSALIAKCEEADSTRCRVASFYGGSEYRLITKLEIQDLRIVYAPPESIGSYGGDTDNWVWPRHSGDFAFLRAYVSPTGESAPFSEENVPYQPDSHLVVADAPLTENDFVMVAGFPGGTYRHRHAMELTHAINVGYPQRIERYDDTLRILRTEMEKDSDLAVLLAAKIGWLENGRKYTQGMLDGFASTDAAVHLVRRDNEIDIWIAQDRGRRRSIGKSIKVLRENIAVEQGLERTWQVVSGLLSSPWLSMSHTALRWSEEQAKPDLERESGLQKRDFDRIQARSKTYDKTMHRAAERALVTYHLNRHESSPDDVRIVSISRWIEQNGGVDDAVEKLFFEPKMASYETRMALFSWERAQFNGAEDPWVSLAVAIEEWAVEERRATKERQGESLEHAAAWSRALAGVADDVFYPDANGTLRLTVGHVKGYSPSDAVEMLPFTTLSGIISKAGPAPYDAPLRLIEAIPNASESKYYVPHLGSVPVNFTTTLDSTGGNSGSATLNGKGEVVGFLFDGNYEAMTADWLFDDALTRSIHVDIRYVLWILDEVAQMDWLVDELVPPRASPVVEEVTPRQ
jgi:hypothetical protein